MTSDDTIPYRARAAITAKGAIAIFLPLFAVIAWWALVHRYAPAYWAMPRMGTLPAGVALLAAALAAGGPAVLLALIIANRARLHGVVRVTGGKVLTALGLALITPFAIFSWVPWLTGTTFVMLIAGGFNPHLMLSAFATTVILAFLWYFPSALLISGIRSHALRIMAFMLAWWTVYAVILLAYGFQIFML